MALALYFLFIKPPPFWPFLTAGHIYVESPGVYTRERLVNDRYSQDFWLRTQLGRLDDDNDLIRKYVQSQVNAGTPDKGEPGNPVTLSFQDEFLLRAAIRDKLRQMILENLLDDRHDLSGNSIYGLKFNTAVVPGDNTYYRPYVVVRIDANTLPAGRKPIDFLAGEATNEYGAATGDFGDTHRQYDRWRGSVQSRLNSFVEERAYIHYCPSNEAPDRMPGATTVAAEAVPDDDKADVFTADLPPADTTAEEVSAPGPSPWESADWELYQRWTVEALRYVLGIAAHEVRVENPSPFLTGAVSTFTVPTPWRRFFSIQVQQNDNRVGAASPCGPKFNIQLRPRSVAVLLMNKDDWQLEQDRRVRGEPGIAGIDAYSFVTLPSVAEEAGVGAWWATPNDGAEEFVRSLSTPELEMLLRRPSAPGPETCLVQEPDATGEAGAETCRLRGRRFFVNASHYDFLREISRSIPYSYAVFPRGDVEGVLSDRSFGLGFDAPGLIDETLNLSGLFRSREVGAEPVVVNYAGGQSESAASGAFDFGWAIVRPGLQKPSQMSQLVLVSVPAYLDKLDLVVETGWLDRKSDPIGLEPKLPEAADESAERRPLRAGERQLMRMTVALPPDYEAIDTLLAGTRLQGPVINQTRFGTEFSKVQPCQDADILIPGERLWRSTSVTLGGQLADRITVTPDMGGIIASFEPVDPLPGGGPKARLAVWTSEGMDNLDRYITIDGDCPKAAAEGD